jgi:hypothetical protein
MVGRRLFRAYPLAVKCDPISPVRKEMTPRSVPVADVTVSRDMPRHAAVPNQHGIRLVRPYDVAIG